MNRRAYRLFAPGIAFGIVGLLILSAGAGEDFRLVGGLVVTGLYGLGVQVVLSLLLVASIDDFGDRGRATPTRSTGHMLADRYNERARSFDLSQALPRFYASFAAPMALLAFGLGATLSAIVDGALADLAFTDRGWHPSEIVLFGIMIVGASILLVRGNVGSFCGWCLGFTLAAAIGQVRFIAGTVGSTLTTWLLITGGVCAVRVLSWAVLAGWRRLAHWRVTPATR